MTFHIRRSEPPADGLRRIAREQIGIVLRDFTDDRLNDEERVHSLRARCKKMRALLRLPGPLMCERFKVEDARFRSAAKRLATARDLHVQAQTLAALGEASDEVDLPAAPVSPSAIEKSLEDLRKALAAIETWPIEVGGFFDLAPGFARTYRKCRKAWMRTLAEPSDEHFHKLRKWTKYHWYQVRILERVNKPVLRDRRIELQVLGEILGSAHDLTVLDSMLRNRPDTDPKLLQLAARRKHGQYLQALKISKLTFTPNADALVADMSGWWSSWRPGATTTAMTVLPGRGTSSNRQQA